MTFLARNQMFPNPGALLLVVLYALALPCAAWGAVGDHLWSNGYDAYGFSSLDGTGAVATAGNIWSPVSFGGPTLTPSGFGGDVFLTRHDGGGNHLWSQQFIPNGGCTIDAIGTDESGNIFIAGTLSAGEFGAETAVRTTAFGGSIDFGGGPITGDFELFIAGFDAGGNHLFSRVIGDGFATSLAAGGGSVVLTGYTYGVLDFGGGPLGGSGGADAFIASVTTSGAHIWSTGFGGAGDQGGMAVATDPSGGCVLAAGIDSPTSFGGSTLVPNGPDLCLVRFSPAGVHQWSRVFDGTFNGGAGINFNLGLDVSSVDDRIALAGELYNVSEVGGASFTSAGQGDIFVAVYDGSGNHQWSSRYGGSSYDAAQGVAFDSQGDVFVTGTFASNACSFGGSSYSPAIAFTDFFVALYDPSGAHLWSNALGYSNSQVSLKAGVAPNGNLFAHGSGSPGTDLGGGALAAGDIVHGMYQGVSNPATAVAPGLAVARLHAPVPNPFNPTTVLRVSVSAASRATLDIFDARGRHVRSLHRGTIAAGDHEFVWNGEADDGQTVGSGVYLVRLDSDGTRQSRKLVLMK